MRRCIQSMCQFLISPIKAKHFFFSDSRLLLAQEDKLEVQKRLTFAYQITYDVTIFAKLFIKFSSRR